MTTHLAELRRLAIQYQAGDLSAYLRFNDQASKALPLLLDAAEALRGVGWNEKGGKCWCPESPEQPDGSMREHTERCLKARAVLAALDKN